MRVRSVLREAGGVVRVYVFPCVRYLDSIRLTGFVYG